MFSKTLLLFVITVFFIGCTATFDTVDMPKSYQENHEKNKNLSQYHSTSNSTGFYKPLTFGTNQNKTTSKIKKNERHSLNFSGNGYIKGIIQKVYYSKTMHKWIYHIKGTDFSNNKLKYAKVYGLKKLAHPYDLIYAVINNGFITSLYIYKTSKSYKANKKRKIVKKSKQKRKALKKSKKSPKTRKREQVISAPEVEKVIF